MTVRKDMSVRWHSFLRRREVRALLAAGAACPFRMLRAPHLMGRARMLRAPHVLGRLRQLSTAPLTVLEPLDVLAPATRVLRMQRPPVNSLNLELLASFADSLAEAEGDKACRAVVLASSSPKVFSAGLDITEMHEPDPERLRSFWRTLQEV